MCYFDSDKINLIAKMKPLVLTLLLLTLLSCKKSDPKVVNPDPETVQNFDWLVGNWIRTNEKDGKETYENWIKKSSSEYTSHGFTLKDNDTVWQEKVRLAQSGADWNFSVTAPGEAQETVFKLTQVKTETFTCENQQNEFPKIIRYLKKGESLYAVISGGGTEIPFEFKRLSNLNANH